MKKVVLFAIALLGCAVMATAQPKAIGGRLGWGLGASYEHYLGEPNFLEFDAEMFNVDNIGFRLDGIYNFVFAEPDWTPRGTWQWYAGPGVALGSAHYNNDNNFFFMFEGQVGLEYKFWFNLQLSADLRPGFGICDGKFYTDGFYYGFLPTLSVRYYF